MKLSLWRYIHLIGASLASIFLTIASLTGVILALYALFHEGTNYRADNFSTATLSQVLPSLQKEFAEIQELKTDPRGFVTVKGLSKNEQELHTYIDINTGKALAQVSKRSKFMQNIITLHRSLFLHQTGRYIMGGVAVSLVIISLSGMVLVIKRQGWRNFFKKGIKDNFYAFWHTLIGRWLLIPMLIIGISGAYISFLKSFDNNENDLLIENSSEGEMLLWSEIPIFKSIKLSDVQKITFPLFKEEVFILKLFDKELFISPTTGEILQEIKYSAITQGFFLNKQIHKGTFHPLIVIVLGLSCLGMLFFIYSGFTIWLQRKNTRIINPYSTKDANYIILFGSEGGSTAFFATQIHKELLSNGIRSFIGELNDYQYYPQATHLLIITCTYGEGQAPSNANKFIKKLPHTSQNKLYTSVLGFGSDKYPDFCAFAKEIQKTLENTPWANVATPLSTVNKKSLSQAMSWVKIINENFNLHISSKEENYKLKKGKMPKMKVIEAIPVQGKDEIFSLKLKTKHPFRSGDLLAIYPTSTQERFYSIGKINGNIILTIKRHYKGIGSNYLYKLRKGDKFRANIVENKNFHLPCSGEIILISNGTGIAPFLGMIDENKLSLPLYLYACFAYNTPTIEQYLSYLESSKLSGKISNFKIGFTRENKKNRVTELVAQDIHFITQKLNSGATLMVCGSLKMYNDVAEILQNAGINTSELEESEQIKTDCY